MHKILICGDRKWSDKDKIKAELAQYDPADTIVISGGAQGADTLAAIVAFELGFRFKEFPAEWARYGKAAGPIRNQQMLDEHPEFVLAFHSNISESKGTADMIARARRKGTPVKLVK